MIDIDGWGRDGRKPEGDIRGNIRSRSRCPSRCVLSPFSCKRPASCGVASHGATAKGENRCWAFPQRAAANGFIAPAGGEASSRTMGHMYCNADEIVINPGGGAIKAATGLPEKSNIYQTDQQATITSAGQQPSWLTGSGGRLGAASGLTMDSNASAAMRQPSISLTAPATSSRTIPRQVDHSTASGSFMGFQIQVNRTNILPRHCGLVKNCDCTYQSTRKYLYCHGKKHWECVGAPHQLA